MEGNVVQMQDIFLFNRTHTDGRRHGPRRAFRATGLRPRCLDEMIRRGIPYDTANFDPTKALRPMEIDAKTIVMVMIGAAVFAGVQGLTGAFYRRHPEARKR